MFVSILLCIVLEFGLHRTISEASECTDRGRYPSNEGSDCQGYTMCLIGGTTNFTQYNIKCPTGFIYSHLEQQCTNVTSYHCLPTYNCTNPGNLVNPDSENCTSYIACIEGISELVTARLIQCPLNTTFNPATGDCVNDYKCNSKGVDFATIPNLEVDSYQYNGNFSFNGVEFQMKSTYFLYIMIILFAFQ
ncbi:hypothetical protein K1T71_005181 [Dendrolimus kikuchii]|uniref:Uncharacterized protein n=1 Tax=Dendrolimus kikuchii TaxID=765133 RepID=A0ACC1D6W1_9NEOP|nr:hypothetical protein K1T71_005181 [Dendrolimus kikuchii]